MQILILQSFTGDPEDEHMLLAPKDMAYPEDTANLVIRRVAEHKPDLSWTEVIEPLRAAGFVEPATVVVAKRPWDETRVHDMITFKVMFPATAPHEYAGKELIATNSTPFENKMIVLHDDQNQIFNADDQLWSSKAKYLEQVPLGPIEVPDAQFSNPNELQKALRLLEASGYELARNKAVTTR